MPNKYCQTFKQKIEKLKGKAQNIEDLLLKYKETGNEEIVQELDRILQEILQEILKEIEKFKKEYEQKVKKLLKKWYPEKNNINKFLKNLKINERERIEIKELDLSSCNLSGPLYLPSLFEKIEELNCFYNQLTSLPELPDGLKKLDCSYNQLTSLPKLPDGLEEFDCEGNPLPQETIKRI